MVQKLALIAIAGLVASAACIGAAAAIGARDFGSLNIPFFGGPSCGNIPGATATSRAIDWDGSNTAGIAIRGVANYAPGSGGDKLHATGDAQVLAHLRIRDGVVEMDCSGWRERDTDVTITLPGRAFEKFILTGTGKMNLDHLNQASLKIQVAGVATIRANGKVDDLGIDMAGVSKADLDQITAHQAKVSIGGAGTVRANGKIDDVKIEIGGSGRADFGQVASRTAKVSIGGSGNADIAPSDDAKIEIGGSGDVTLHSDPKQMDTSINGPGGIRKVSP